MAIVGTAGQRELLNELHADNIYETDVYYLGRWCIIYDLVDLAQSRLDTELSALTGQTIYQELYQRERVSVVVFVVQDDTDVRDFLIHEVAALKLADFDFSRVVVHGPAQVAARVARELRLGHHVSQVDVLRDLLLAILRDTSTRDTIVLHQTTEEVAGRSSRC